MVPWPSTWRSILITGTGPRGYRRDRPRSPLPAAMDEDGPSGGTPPLDHGGHGRQTPPCANSATSPTGPPADARRPPCPSRSSPAHAPVARPFEPGRDDAAWLSVNNRGLRRPSRAGQLDARRPPRAGKSTWFDRDGFLVADRPDGRLLGSCWTKIHRTTEPALGEIYVISVDPSATARVGDGPSRWPDCSGSRARADRRHALRRRGANAAAVALYRSLGFTVDHVDRSYLSQSWPRAGSVPVEPCGHSTSGPCTWRRSEQPRQRAVRPPRRRPRPPAAQCLETPLCLDG